MVPGIFSLALSFHGATATAPVRYVLKIDFRAFSRNTVLNEKPVSESIKD